MVSTSAWSACGSPACEWIGKILPSWRGQDNTFFSPLSPTSFASLALPAFSYAGNLWGWIPQVRVEHRFNLSEGQSISAAGRHPGQRNRRAAFLFAAFRRRPGRVRASPPTPHARAWTAQRFRQASHPGHGRLLQPPELGLRPPCGWLGRHDGLERSAGAGVSVLPANSIVAARSADWVAAVGTERAVQRESQSAGAGAALNSVGGWSQLKVHGHQ